MKRKEAAIATVAVFFIVFAIIVVLSLLVWGGITMWQNKCYWGLGLEAGFTIFIMMIFIYFEFKRL